MNPSLDTVSKLDFLPAWMVLVIAIMLITVPLIMELIRQRRVKRYEEGQTKIVNNLVLNQEALSKNFNMLLDVLYEKYANNLTLEVSKQIMELVYYKTKSCIINRIQDYIHDDSKYIDGKFDVNRVREDVKMLISTKYYQDIMILNKMTCKGYKLSDHLSTQVRHEEVSDKILSLLTIYTNHNIYRGCVQIKKDLDSYFNVIINKGKTFLEKQTE